VVGNKIDFKVKGVREKKLGEKEKGRARASRESRKVEKSKMAGGRAGGLGLRAQGKPLGLF